MPDSVSLLRPIGPVEACHTTSFAHVPDDVLNIAKRNLENTGRNLNPGTIDYNLALANEINCIIAARSKRGKPVYVKPGVLQDAMSSYGKAKVKLDAKTLKKIIPKSIK